MEQTPCFFDKRDNSSTKDDKPVVLIIGGHDPGGAGVYADVETCAANGCLALTIITALTSQNTSKVGRILPTDLGLVLEQLDMLLEEFSPDAIKIGLIPTEPLCTEIAQYLSQYLGSCPVVLDPVLEAGGSSTALNSELVPESIINHLLPAVTLVTPNKSELSILTKNNNHGAAIDKLLDTGVGAVLATDLRNTTKSIENVLRCSQPETKVVYKMRRHPKLHHGTGCTLASAIACSLAKGSTTIEASISGQQFVHEAVLHSIDLNLSQNFPNRFYKQRS